MPLDVSPFELLNTAAFLLCVTFCAYVISILVLYLRVPRLSGGDHRDYDWHIVVPCLNEAAVIDGTIRRLLRDFPRATIWCVDDNSDDGTAELVAEVVTGLGTDPRLRLIRRVAPDARQGKGAALNAAWRAIDRDLPAYADRSRVIVGVLDADSQLHARCLSALTGARYFGTDDVAAVQIEVRMLQCAPSWDNQRSLGRRARLLVRLQDMEFRGPIAAMQELRRRTGSVGMGGNGQFTRMSMLDRIAVRHGTPWHGALLEDFELGLHVLLNGGRTEYCPETWVAQEALTGIRPLIRQRTRWAQGSMQCVRYAPAVLRSRRIKNAGALEIVYFLAAPWTQLFGTIVYLGCLSVLGYYVAQAANGVQGWWSGGGWGVVPLVLVFGIAPFTVWGLAYRSRCEPGLRLTTALGLGLAHWLYSYVQSVAVWLAFVRLITFRTEWQKTARSDDPVRVLTRHRQPRRRSNRPRTRTATSRKQSADAQNSFQIHPLHSGSGRGIALALLAATPAMADTSQSSGAALQISLVGGGIASSGSASASNDGTTESISGNQNPPLAVLGGQTVITAGVLNQYVRAFNDGTSAACAGVLGSGGSISIGPTGNCIVNNGAEVDLVLGANGLATINLRADALYASCNATSSPSATGTASLVNARITSTILGIETTLLNLPVNPAPNTGLSIPGVLDILLNSQSSNAPGQLEVSALDITALGGALASVQVGDVTCGANAVAPPIPAIPLAGAPVALGVIAVAATGGILIHRRRRQALEG